MWSMVKPVPIHSLNLRVVLHLSVFMHSRFAE